MNIEHSGSIILPRPGRPLATALASVFVPASRLPDEIERCLALLDSVRAGAATGVSLHQPWASERP